MTGDESDAVAGKLSVVYSRGEVRDFIDLDAIRTSGRYSDSELMALGQVHDAGFAPYMFAQQLARISHIPASDASQYGIDPVTFGAIQKRLLAWSRHLRH